MKHKKIKLTTILLAVISLTSVQAQQVADAAGGNASGAGGTVSYSVGQVVYTSNSGGGVTSNEGVQQPFEFVAVGISDNEDISLAYSIYPNPTTASVILNVANQNLENLSYRVYDISGKLLINQKVSNAVTSVPMETFANASYLLKVMNNNSEIKTFKIIKNK